MLNVVCGGGLCQRPRRVARNAACMIVRGMLERKDGVVNLVADRLVSLAELQPEAARALHARHRSRDFQ
ncbi:hypothetical protein [Jiangella muralis]|uniref:hypothetical protein n=1 Tax=Jiangella muralis TaxID=702383 RepID=UPI00069D8F61|nr:hypothetical protein [Jiangella muralis]